MLKGYLTSKDANFNSNLTEKEKRNHVKELEKKAETKDLVDENVYFIIARLRKNELKRSQNAVMIQHM